MKTRMMQLFLLFGLSVSYAAQTPIFQLTPLTPTTVEIGTGETATVSYRVTNLLPQAMRLAWKPVANITQDTTVPNSCVASQLVASGGSCLLTLSTTSIISAAPEVCNITASGTFNPFYCSRSSDEDRMVTTRRALAPISVTGSPLVLVTNQTGTLTVTNDSTAITAINVSADISGALSDAGVTQDASACNSIDPGASCILRITAGDTAVTTTLARVSGMNTNTASSLIAVNAPPLQEIALTSGSPLALVANGSDSGTMTITNISDSVIAAGVTAHFEGTALNGNVSADTCGIITAGGTCILTFTSTGTTSVPSTDFPIYGDGTTEITGNITLFNSYAYVALIGSSSVQKCSVHPTTGALSDCSLTGSGFNTPFGITLNNGYAYVTNNVDSTVTKCTVDSPNGELSSCASTPVVTPPAVAPFERPRGVLIHNGFAYVANNVGNDLTKCEVRSSDGEFLGCESVSEGFSRPQDIAIFNNRAYITNRSVNTVSMCNVNTVTGALSGCVETPSSGGGFNAPYGITIANGYAYIVNFDTDSVSKCNVSLETGELSLCTITESGLSQPINTSVNNGFAYISNAASDSVSKCIVNPDDGSLASCNPTGGIFDHPAFNYIYLL